MKDMLRSALGGPGGGSIFSNVSQGVENMGTARSLALNVMGAPNSAASEGFGGGFPPPLSAGLDGSATGGGQGPGSRRQSAIGGVGAGPRQILPGQLPGPAPATQRKGSIASVASMGGS